MPIRIISLKKAQAGTRSQQLTLVGRGTRGPVHSVRTINLLGRVGRSKTPLKSLRPDIDTSGLRQNKGSHPKCQDDQPPRKSWMEQNTSRESRPKICLSIPKAILRKCIIKALLGSTTEKGEQLGKGGSSTICSETRKTDGLPKFGRPDVDTSGLKRNKGSHPKCQDDQPPRKSGAEQNTSRESRPNIRPSTSKAIPRKCIIKALFKSTYERGALLGKGGFGSVYAGTRKRDGLPVAIKYVSKSSAGEYIQMPGQEGPLPLEVALMKQVNADPPCPYITQLLDWFDYPTRCVLVLERPVPCQDLIDYCKNLGGCMSEFQAQRVLRQLLLAIQHCHQRGVLHRDIKPGNILIRMDTLEIKLLDFGCGDLLRVTPYKRFAGTPEYLPPEWFQKKQYLAGPATVWSLGVTLIKLVCGYQPFLTVEDTIRGLQHLKKCVSPELRDLICLCLNPRAADRPTLEEIKFHSWLHQSET